jgi:hypothetical protein
MRVPRSAIAVVLVVGWAGAFVAPAAAGPPAAVPAAAVPDVVTATVAELLGDGIAAESGDGRLTIWPVRELPAGGGADGLGIAFPALSPGGLLGVVELSAPWTDYRGQQIAPGVYTLRYLVEPEDGYHLGVSLYRDFALLVTAAEDADPATRTMADLVQAAAGAAGTKHPAVLALWPVGETAAGESFDNDLGQPTLVIEVGGVRLGMVLAGTGEVGG